VIGMIKTWACERRKYGVRINTVAPSFILPIWHANSDASYIKAAVISFIGGIVLGT
jgi:NAD(P)-dependent dehydrogenase (short-subunit alcohol dehydrogenase family)